MFAARPRFSLAIEPSPGLCHSRSAFYRKRHRMANQFNGFICSRSVAGALGWKKNFAQSDPTRTLIFRCETLKMGRRRELLELCRNRCRFSYLNSPSNKREICARPLCSSFVCTRSNYSARLGAEREGELQWMFELLFFSAKLTFNPADTEGMGDGI